MGIGLRRWSVERGRLVWVLATLAITDDDDEIKEEGATITQAWEHNIFGN